ncbi:MAG: 3-hydroxyacyl-CoA dehydrogenase family protein [Ruminococcaceae bacterium]|nr:3-hydroxyacyl-CoA dehydrogenase family protein [Oscillospiraceae bacterium]
MEFKKVGIIGTGLMGGGIAQVCAQVGYTTVSYDVNEAAFDRTRGIIQASMDKMVARGKFTAEYVAETLARMSYTTDIQQLADCDIVVEAVFENLEVKLNVLKQVEAVVSEKCLIFSNTSALSITTLGTALQHPERFMGTHFFSPVPVMKLVELVPGMETSEETYMAAARWAESIKKVSIKAPDTCGFISNRLMPLPQNEGAELIALGVDPADIDACWILFNKAPMGTMAIVDSGGSHVTLGCLTSIYEGMEDDRYRPHHYIKQLVAAGRLGVKTGQGIFKY